MVAGQAPRVAPEAFHLGGGLKRPIVVAMVSRGRGCGHVVPDMAFIDELCAIEREIAVRWISYGTGAEKLREQNREVLDLQLPDNNPFLETQLRLTRALATMRPDLVVAHEEFSAAPVARLLGIPNLFITDYFVASGHLWMQCLAYTDEVIFIDRCGFFEEPAFLKGKVSYVGSPIRKFAYAKWDRDRARHELGLSVNDTVVTVLPGSWFTERRAPIFDLVIDAFDRLPQNDKVLIWFAGEDRAELIERTKDRRNVLVKDFEWQLDRWMVASDLAITKGTRKTSIELAALGIPSVSLSHRANVIDDIRVSQISTNTFLYADETDGARLASTIDNVLLISRERYVPPGAEEFAGVSSAARVLAHHVGMIRKRLLRESPRSAEAG